MNYKLIKYYPGSPPLGTVVYPLIQTYQGIEIEKYKTSDLEFITDSCNVEGQAEFWKPVKEVDIEQILLHHCTIDTFRANNSHVNIGESGVRLSCKPLSFVVEASYFRSALRNTEICKELFKQYLSHMPESVLDKL